jgi:hypothetical protein
MFVAEQYRYSTMHGVQVPVAQNAAFTSQCLMHSSDAANQALWYGVFENGVLAQVRVVCVHGGLSVWVLHGPRIRCLLESVLATTQCGASLYLFHALLLSQFA